MRVKKADIDRLHLQHFFDDDTDGYAPADGNMQKTLLRTAGGMLCSVAKKGLLGCVWWSDQTGNPEPITIDPATGLFISVEIV